MFHRRRPKGTVQSLPKPPITNFWQDWLKQGEFAEFVLWLKWVFVLGTDLMVWCNLFCLMLSEGEYLLCVMARGWRVTRCRELVTEQTDWIE